jgi:CubicO group peptidase (beta-lactamase class C family)
MHADDTAKVRRIIQRFSAWRRLRLSALPALALAINSETVPAQAQQPALANSPSIAVSTAQAPTIDTALFRAVDEWVLKGLERYEIAGAALAIVQNGSIVHRRGFGRGNIASDVVVIADSTIFHIASVTKLLTAIGALQLVESGKLQLTSDTRSALGVINSPGWSTYPVSLHQLLTHSAGLDTRWIGMATTDPARVQSLDEYLQHETPPIIDAPESIIRYSNHGYALVGRLIEKTSGMTWAQYVEQRVMQPLGMMQSHALPRPLGKHHARPYRYRRDTLEEPSVFEHAAPGGAVRATVTDVGRLLVALLDTASSVPLSPQGKRMLLEPQMHIGGALPGYAYGTFPYPNPYIRAASMGGEVPGFSTRLLMVPELQLGIVLMVNRKDPSLAISMFDSLLVRVAGDRTAGGPVRHVCVQQGQASATSGTREQAERTSAEHMAGTYRSNVYDRGSFLKIGALLGPTLTVEADTGNTLIVVNPLEDRASRWTRSDNGAWHTTAGECMTLTSDTDTPLLAITTRFAGPVMLERTTWYNGMPFVMSLTSIALMVMLFTLLMTMVNRLRGRAAMTPAIIQLSTILLAVGHLVFTIAFAVGLAQLAIVNDDRFAFGLPTWFTVTLLLPVLLWTMTAVLAIALLRRNASGQRHHRRAWIVLAASAVLCAVQVTWHIHGL